MFDTESLLLIDWNVYAQSIEVGIHYSISFYIGAIKRNKKGDESSHTLTICMFFSLLYLLSVEVGDVRTGRTFPSRDAKNEQKPSSYL